ncbi:MAG: heparinase [Calditrichaeota bacterium]|nr:heparinase [Calditrichota bacterium]
MLFIFFQLQAMEVIKPAYGFLQETDSKLEIPHDRLLEKNEIIKYILPDLQKSISTHDDLISYLKDQFKKRYYFNWSNFENNFASYQKTYPNQETKHQRIANYHTERYPADTQWILPYVNLLNKEVTAYELRHIARQQKSLDMTLIHYYKNRNSSNLRYFIEQVSSLNNAFLEGKYDQAGNGVYESFRAGKRIHNWLFCHAAYFSDPEYSIENQSLLIRTFLHHGAILYKNLPVYRPGNHHTRGLVALFEIATLFSDFNESKKWQEHAVKGIIEHMRHEINDDGFQFERSVHYHKGDIENYFRIYQLAKRSKTELPEEFKLTFQKMFDALIVLAQPNKTLPVLQDDTDNPYSEFNEMGDAFYLASMMYNDQRYGYFASKKPSSKFYWLMNEKETNYKSLTNIAPELSSSELDGTGYYIMRDGWDESSMQMVISAGVSDVKPDHQHGDILGVTAFGFGTELLPNYQVAYKYPDFSFLKNSWVKNVALVDSQVQGQKWKGNRGGSGFGKWKQLPKPNVLAWVKTDNFDYFAGTHDGFSNLDIKYIREIIFVKGKYWLVTDSFEGDESHTYQQVWQGKFTIDSKNKISRSVNTESKFSIIQLDDNKYSFDQKEFREKRNTVFSIKKNNGFVFNTMLYPSSKKRKSFEEIKNPVLKFETDARLVFEAGNGFLLIDATSIKTQNGQIKIPAVSKVFIEQKADSIQLTLLAPKSISCNKKENEFSNWHNFDWQPGELTPLNL